MSVIYGICCLIWGILLIFDIIELYKTREPFYLRIVVSELVIVLLYLIIALKSI